MTNKLASKIIRDNEIGSRRQILEELFNDFYVTRYKIYFFNFVRGLFFGFGTVLGGTVLVAILVWLLSKFSGLLPDVIGDFVQQIIDAMQKTK